MRKFGLSLLFAFTVILPLLTGVADASPSFTDPNFKQLWERTDKILTERSNVGRGFVWGADSIFTAREIYTEAQGQQRLVQYFDKGRMEITYSSGNRTDYNFVTSGLLVKELVLGRQQNGNDINNYTQGIPAEVQIAGDPNLNGANVVAPTYRSFRNVTTFDRDNPADPRLGQQILQRIDRAGNLTSISSPDPGVRIGAYEALTKHNIADVFINYGNTHGLVWNGSSYVNGPLFFPNATYVLGLPVTEPYWIRTIVGGIEKDVLVQLFERRVLTYTPANDINNRVEMGNVGVHYYRWRYLENIGFGSPRPAIASDYSQARTPYLKSGPVPQGVNSSSTNLSSYSTGSTFINSSPVYDPNLKLAIIGTHNSGVVAVDVTNFNTPVERWHFQASGPRFIGPVVLSNGVVYIGGSDGRVYALRENEGTLIWSGVVTNEFNGGVYTQVALDADTLYCTAGDGLLHALNLSTGVQKWQAKGPGSASLTNGPIIAPDGTIYVTATDQRIYAFKRDGSQVPSSTWNPVALDGALYATPAWSNERLYVVTSNGTLYALNSSGNIQTQKTFTAAKAIFGTPAVVNVAGSNRVFIGTRDGNVYGVDADNVGNVRWVFSVSGGAEVNSSVAVVDNFVYIAADDKKIYRVDATNAANSLILAIADDLFDVNSPIVNSGYVFVAPRSSGKLLMIR